MQAASSSAGATVAEFDAETNWQHNLGSWPRGWHGWVGRWALYGADGKEPTRAWDGARLFCNKGDDTYEQVNIYSESVMSSSPGEQRPQDGGWQKTWGFNKADSCLPDGWWHPWLKKDGRLKARIVAAAPGRSATLTFALPLKEFTVEDPSPLPFWNSELFVRPAGTKYSWSGGIGYDANTGKFQTIFLIREGLIHDDPAEPLQLSRRPELWDERVHLPQNPRVWAPAGTNWRGVSQELRWDSAGSMSVTAEQPVDWSPPSEDLQLTTLPDGVYAAYPEALPLTAADVPAQGIQLQFGGLADESMFTRTVLDYGPDGVIRSVRFDEFTNQ